MTERPKGVGIQRRRCPLIRGIAAIVLALGTLTLQACGHDGSAAGDGTERMPVVGQATAGAGAIMFDVNQWWDADDPTDRVLIEGHTMDPSADRLQVAKDGDTLRFVFTDMMGVDSDISVPVSAWEPGTTHTVTASWSNGVTALYVDGALVGHGTSADPTADPSQVPLLISSSNFGTPPTSASVGHVTIFDRPLTAAEVALLTPDRQVELVDNRS